MAGDLARALATEASWLLADEPVAALDPAHALSVMCLFRKKTEAGTGIVTVLHDLPLAARFCDRLVLISDGRVRACGTPAEVLTDENVRDVYGVSIRRVEGAVIPWDLL